MKAAYCSQVCQKKHWPNHKLNCATPAEETARIKSWMMQMGNKISGNIFTMAAHGYHLCGVGVVCVELNETASEMTTPGSIHIAHIKFITETSLPEFIAKYKIVFPQLSKERVIVVYLLQDFICVAALDPKGQTLEQIRQNTTNPVDDLSVVFNL